jgi:phage gp29-like protein
MAVLDQYGRPVRHKQLVKQLAEPGITSIRNAWAPTIASGLTPERLAGILLAANEGNIDEYLTLAEEMEERDPHYGSVLSIRKRAVSGVIPVVKPASDAPRDVNIADDVRAQIAEHDGFSDLVEDMLDALGKGFSVTEIEWQKSAKKWTPARFVHRDPRFFTFDRNTGQEIRLIDEADMVDGVSLEPFKFIAHKAKLKSGLPIRGGLARLVAFGWMCKAYATKDWIAFVETYGLPLRLGRYGARATKEDVEVLFTAVANIGTDAAAVLPDSMSIDFEEISGGQGNDIFENLARWVDEQTSKAVLGQTMTSDNGSSQAQAKVHNDVRHDVAVADGRAVSGTLNRDLVKPYVDLNYGVQESYPRIALVIEEPEDLDLIIKNTERMARVGVRFKQDEIRQRMGYSTPGKNDEVVGGQPQPAKPGTALNRAHSGDLFEVTDALEDELNEDWEDVLGDVMEPVFEVIASADGYEDAMKRLRNATPNMGSDKIIEALVKGAIKARAEGGE